MTRDRMQSDQPHVESAGSARPSRRYRVVVAAMDWPKHRLHCGACEDELFTCRMVGVGSAERVGSRQFPAGQPGG